MKRKTLDFARDDNAEDHAGILDNCDMHMFLRLPFRLSVLSFSYSKRPILIGHYVAGHAEQHKYNFYAQRCLQ